MSPAEQTCDHVPEFPLPWAEARQVDLLCDEFEQQWREGGRPSIDDFLARVPESAVAVLRDQLLAIEQELHGGGPDPGRGEESGPLALGAAPLPGGQASPPPSGSTSPMPPTLTGPFGGGGDGAVPAGNAPPSAPVAGYEILGELGRGAMGVVYKARQVKLKRLVALKMILAGGHAGAQELQRFRSEAEAIARLQHPNIVQIHEVGEHDGLPFFSLEFCPGGSLDRKLDGTPWPPQDAARLVETLARAMHAAHQADVIHRDLKPQNVLLSADGTPKVTDFGLAKKLDESGQTASGVVMGTPSYMAPEQAAGQSKDVSPATDVHALGAILYELLTGRPPFRGATTLDTLLQVLEHFPERPRAFNPAVNAPLEGICLRALEKDPRDRYPTALALAEDLAAYRRGDPVLAEGTSNLRLMRLLLQESRHTEVLRLWGRVWQWQAGIVFGSFAVTNLLLWFGVSRAKPYAICWAAGLLALNVPVWRFRLREGPTFTRLERQAGEVWYMWGLGCLLTAGLWALLGIPWMTLLPVVVMQCAVAIGCLSAILGGTFRLLAVVVAVMAFVLVLAPDVGPLLFGAVFGVALYGIGRKFARDQPASVKE